MEVQRVAVPQSVQTQYKGYVVLQQTGVYQGRKGNFYMNTWDKKTGKLMYLRHADNRECITKNKRKSSSSISASAPETALCVFIWLCSIFQLICVFSNGILIRCESCKQKNDPN